MKIFEVSKLKEIIDEYSGNKTIMYVQGVTDSDIKYKASHGGVKLKYLASVSTPDVSERDGLNGVIYINSPKGVEWFNFVKGDSFQRQITAASFKVNQTFDTLILSENTQDINDDICKDLYNIVRTCEEEMGIKAIYVKP